MESANKSALFVLVVLLGVGLYVWRDRVVGLFNHSNEMTPVKQEMVASKGSDLLQGGAVLVEAFGAPYVSENAFNKKLQQMLQASPYTKNMDPATFPAEAKAKFLKDWVNFLLIKDIWGKKHNVENDPVFKKRYEESVEALKDSLIIEAYVQDLKKKVSVSDDEVSVEYQSNKDRYAKAPGGAHIVVSIHGEPDSAKNLQKKCEKTQNADSFMTAAQDLGAENVIDLGFVDSRGSASAGSATDLPAEVRRVVFGSHKDTCVQLSVGGKHYLVFVTEKKAPEFFELDEIRPQLKMMLEESKQKEALEAALEEMSSSANLVFNTGVWDKQPKVLSKDELRAAVEQDEASFDDEFTMQQPSDYSEADMNEAE